MAAAGTGQFTPRATSLDAIAKVERFMAAGLVAAIFAVMGLGVKQLAAISAAELPDAVTALFVHNF